MILRPSVVDQPAMIWRACIAAAMLITVVGGMARQPADFQDIIDSVAVEISSEYNCSVNIALYSEAALMGARPGAATALVATAGFVDAGLNMGKPTRHSQPEDVYVWGSITKMFTGPAVLQLVDAGVMMLDDPIVKCVKFSACMHDLVFFHCFASAPKL